MPKKLKPKSELGGSLKALDDSWKETQGKRHDGVHEGGLRIFEKVIDGQRFYRGVSADGEVVEL